MHDGIDQQGNFIAVAGQAQFGGTTPPPSQGSLDAGSGHIYVAPPDPVYVRLRPIRAPAVNAEYRPYVSFRPVVQVQPPPEWRGEVYVAPPGVQVGVQVPGVAVGVQAPGVSIGVRAPGFAVGLQAPGVRIEGGVNGTDRVDPWSCQAPRRV